MIDDRDGIYREPPTLEQHRGAVPIDHPDNSITKPKLSFSNLLNEIHLPIAYFGRNLPADSTGVKSENGGVLLSTGIYNSVTAIYLEVSLLQLTGGTVSLELYDYSAQVVRTSVSGLTSPMVRGRSVLNLKPYLVAGNVLGGRLNVTTAGPAGSVAGDGWIRLILKV